MMLHIPQVLSKPAVAELRALIDAADWIDGNATSGSQSALAKRNEQLPEGSEAARHAGERVLDAQARIPLCVTAALPQTVFPPTSCTASSCARAAIAPTPSVAAARPG